MQPFDIDKARYAVSSGHVADWQLNQAFQIFRSRKNPRASLLGILVELGYLDRALALKITQNPALQSGVQSSNFPNPNANPHSSNAIMQSGVSSSSSEMMAPGARGYAGNPMQSGAMQSGAMQSGAMQSGALMGGRAKSSGFINGSSFQSADLNMPANDAPTMPINARQLAAAIQAEDSASSSSGMDAETRKDLVSANGPGRLGGKARPKGPAPRASESAATSQELSGYEKNFGRYELRGIVARGGMGTVYRAYLKDLDKVVALKALSSTCDDIDRARFLQEAKSSAKLRHRNIVPVHDIGIHEGIHYFTMDLIDGQSLDDVVHKSGTYSAEEAAQLGVKLCEALSYAHKNGVIHRDIKPGNILVEKGSNEPYLTDFGLARQVESSTQLTKTGFAVGTPNYMAPEQATGDKDTDARADVYGVGALLFSIVSGQPPFDGPNPLATMTSVVNDPIPSLRDNGANIPEAFDLICQKAMAKGRRSRQQSAAEMASELEAFLANPKKSSSKSSGGVIWVLFGTILLLVLVCAALVMLRLQTQQQYQNTLVQARQALDTGALEQAAALLRSARELKGESETLLTIEKSLTEAKKKHELAEQERRAREQQKQRDEARRRRVDKLLAQAQAARDQDDYLEAQRILKKALKDDPKSPSLIIELAECQMAMDQWRFVRESLALLKSLNVDLTAPKFAERSLFLQASVANAVNRQPEALRLIAELLKAHPDNNSAHLLKAQILCRLGEYKKAESSLEKVLRSGRGGLKARLLKVLLARKQQLWGAILRDGPVLLEQSLSVQDRGQVKLAMAQAWLGLKQNNTKTRAYLNEAGQVLTQLDDLKAVIQGHLSFSDISAAQALIQRLKVLKMPAHELLLLQGDIAFSAMILALRQRRNNQVNGYYKQAEQNYTSAIKSGDSGGMVRYKLAMLYYRTNQTEKALPLFEKAVKQGCKEVAASLALARIYRQLGRHKEAAQWSQVYLQQRPQDWGYYLTYTDSLLKSGAAQEAYRMTLKVLKTNPKRYELNYAHALALKELKRQTQAEAFLVKSFQYLPKDAAGFANRVESSLNINSTEERSRAYLDRFLTFPANNNNWRTFQSLRQTLSNRDKFAWANELNDKLLQTWPQNDTFRIERMRLRFLMDDLEGSLQIGQEIVQKNPNAPNYEIVWGTTGLAQLALGRKAEAAHSFNYCRRSGLRGMANMLRFLILRDLKRDLTEVKAYLAEFAGDLKTARLAQQLAAVYAGKMTREQFEKTFRAAEAKDMDKTSDIQIIVGVELLFAGNKSRALVLLKRGQGRARDQVLRAFCKRVIQSLSGSE